MLRELVIDVAIVSPAPAETTRSRRSVLPPPRTIHSAAFFFMARLHLIKNKTHNCEVQHVAHLQSRPVTFLTWLWRLVQLGPAVDSQVTGGRSTLCNKHLVRNKIPKSSRRALIKRVRAVSPLVVICHVLVEVFLYNTQKIISHMLKHNTFFSWFKNHFVYPWAGGFPMHKRVNHEHKRRRITF